ncbi:MAG: hypothetical protein LH477_01955 [Nocardioides sp.]|nr:hypothetical protein [Nocardioides sp.]
MKVLEADAVDVDGTGVGWRLLGGGNKVGLGGEGLADEVVEPPGVGLRRLAPRFGSDDLGCYFWGDLPAATEGLLDGDPLEPDGLRSLYPGAH